MPSWTFFGSPDQSPKCDEQRPSFIVGTPPSQIPAGASFDAGSPLPIENSDSSPCLSRQSSVRNGRIFTPSMARDQAGSVASTSDSEGDDSSVSSFPGSPEQSPCDSPGSPVDSPPSSLLSSPMFSLPKFPAGLFTALGSPARNFLEAVKREDDRRIRNKANPFAATRALPIAKLEMGVEVERAPFYGHTLAHLYETSQRKHAMRYGSLPSEPLKVIPQIPLKKAMTRSMSPIKSSGARAKQRHSEGSLLGDNEDEH
ncbi:hypothetical protein IQ07DRAFT_680249 [Pyrenochaeta sp. DS3sAY3a]|nr:hypothetical protein IQ07DRAFT_680249 [Pyrenochaeta sp. DS3sAY3a]